MIVIENRRQYRATKAQIARLEGALEASRRTEGKVDPRIYRAMVAGIESQIEQLRQELRDYEELERASELHLSTVAELPELLIKARVARGYTQRDLAERLNLKPQQIQKYEATRYRAVSLRRLLDVMKALDLDFEADIPLRAPGKERAAEPTDAAVREGSTRYRRRGPKKGRTRPG